MTSEGPASLRVLFINSIRMWGGAEVWLMDIMRGLERRGHEVTLVCRPGVVLERNARERGFEVVPVRMRSDFDPITIAGLMRVMRKRRVQVVSTNMEKELRLGGLAARLLGRIAVIPSREVDLPIKNKASYRFTYNVLADAVITNSLVTKRTLLESAPWLEADRIVPVYKGIDPVPFETAPEEGPALRRELGIEPEFPLVGFVGQIIERKGIPDILEAIPRILQDRPTTRFLFVGEGVLEPLVSERAAELGCSENVVCAGFRDDVPAIMKAIDVLLLPSRVEGFGYVLIEAMAAGKPVVATRASSIPEIVEHEGTGILVDVHRPGQIARATLRLLGDPELSRRMGARGRERVRQRFTFDRMVSGFESVFVETSRRVGVRR